MPTDTSIPLPGLSNISLSPSLFGDLALATSGTTCLVEFVNADPSACCRLHRGDELHGHYRR